MNNIQCSNIRGTNNVTSNFEKVPMDLFNYVELDLISSNDFVIYIKLLQLYNEEYGDAFPTVPQLQIMTNKGSKATIHNCISNLIKVGLVEKIKSNYGNNLYIPFQPLSKEELYRELPAAVKAFEKKKGNITAIAENDKMRLQEHLIEKENLEKRSESLNANTIIPFNRDSQPQ